jgi:hypothetical protein
MLASRKREITLVEFPLDEFWLRNGAMSKHRSRFALLLVQILVLNLLLDALSVLEKEPGSAHISLIL